jgi:rhodanese-related sulfurtransferase
MIEISVEDVKALLDEGGRVHLLDVREPQEVALCALPGAENIPMLALFTGQQAPAAAKDARVVVFCHHGQRSFEAARLLQMQGFTDVRSMAGGIDAWAAAFDPTMPRY